jgi:cell division protein FtsQ
MDGGGRLDQPLMRSRLSGDEVTGVPLDERRRPRVGAALRHGGLLLRQGSRALRSTAARDWAGRWALKLRRLSAQSGLGAAASTLLVAGALGYGVVKGNHINDAIVWFKDTRDAAANTLGFRIAAVALTGVKEVNRDEILTTAGVTGRASLLFLDADAARSRLLANPWIAEAAVLKLYPDRLQISITERQAFALWQKDGIVSVIAADGTVLEPFVESRYVGLPLVVGAGAQREAKDFLAVIGRYADIRAQLQASILVAERRWNLRLKNGIDVRLPETDVGAALDRLVALDRDKKLLSRDITMVDLRLPDRVTVRLSDAAAQARDEALQANKKKKKGSDA